MAALATSLLHSNTSSRSWDGLPPQSPPHNSATLKSAIPFFSADSREATIISPRKMLLQLARASPLKGNTREVDQNAEQPGQKRPLRSAQETDDQQPQVGQESKDGSDVLRYVHQKVEGRLDASNADCAQQETEEDKLSAENTEGEGNLISGDTALKGSIVAGLLLVGVVGGFGAVSYIYREQINDFLLEFSDFIEGYGVTGYALFVAVYAGLEILAIPAIPLTMSAGLLFGTLTGTVIVSVSGTIAATAAFLIARYLARDRILKLAEGNKKFLAIDKAIGENGFRVVALLRLSPLLPFSVSNYLYGLTSVELVPYILGSWLGMLPGTWAYVSAGAVGRAIIQQEAENGSGGGPEQLWTIGIGLLVTVIAATYITRLAKYTICVDLFGFLRDGRML